MTIHFHKSIIYATMQLVATSSNQFQVSRSKTLKTQLAVTKREKKLSGH